jgi:hypothetical protein
MTTHDDLDVLIRDQLRTEAPPRAPHGLLDASMARIADTPQRRWRGFPGGSPGRLLAAAAVLLLAVVAGTQLAGLIDRPAGTGESPSPSISPPGTPPSTPTPSSATPEPTTAPEPTTTPGDADELVLRIVAGGGGPTSPHQLLPWASVMADGTVIWQPAPTGPETPSLVARRLTPAGLDELRERIFGGGLLDADASYELERRAGTPEPLGRGVLVFFFTAGAGEDAIVVSSVEWLGDEEESTYYEPSPEREALDALARGLRDPEELLGEDAWDGPAEAYDAAEYLIVLMPTRDTPPYGTMDVSDVPLGFDGPLDEYGEDAADPREPITRCGVVDRGEAEGIVAALLTPGIGAGGMSTSTSASLDWANGNGVVDVFVLPRMPDAYPECADV